VCFSVDGKEVAKIPWNTPPRLRSRRTKPSTSARTRAPGVAMLGVSLDVPFKFTGKIDKLTFKLEPFNRSRARRQGG